MAIALSLKTSGEAAGSGGAMTTASVTIAANALVLVGMAYRDDGLGGSAQTSVSGLSYTWVRGAEVQSGNRSGAVFRSMGAGGSGTLTITGPADATGFTYFVAEITGVDTSGTNGAGAVNNASPLNSASINPANGPQPSVTISGSPGASDYTFAVTFSEDAESGITEEAGWTNLVKVVGTLETSLDAMYHTSHDQTATWTGYRTDGRETITIGAVLKAAAGASSWGAQLSDKHNRLVQEI